MDVGLKVILGGTTTQEEDDIICIESIKRYGNDGLEVKIYLLVK